MMRIMVSWIEQLHSPRCFERSKETVSRDLNPKNIFYSSILNLCNQFTVCLNYLKEGSWCRVSGNEKVMIDLEGRVTEATAIKEKGWVMGIKEELPELKFIRYMLQDHHVQTIDPQQVTVKTRVFVKGESWCLVKWCPTATGSSAPECKLSWMHQSIFLQKFKDSAENHDFPPYLDMSGHASKVVKHNADVIEKELADIVFKYLTSEMDFEGFLAVAKEAIKFSPEEELKIARKFGVTKYTS